MTDVPKKAARILVCENERSIAEDLSRTLMRLGYETTGMVCAGEDPVHVAKETAPDLILMDIELKGLIDGIEAAERIRSHVDVPVVYLIDDADTDVPERVGRTEPYGFVTKSVTMGELSRTIETARRRHAEEKRLRRSERQYRELVETASDGILQTDPVGTVTFANPAFRRMLGFTTDEIIGKTILDFQVSESTREELRAYLDYVSLQQPDPAPWFGTHRTNDGRLIVVQSDWNYRRDEQGNLIGFISVVKDITDREKTVDLILAQRDLALALSSTSDLQTALGLCVTAVLKTSRLDSAGIYLKEHDGSWKLAAHRGFSETFVPRILKHRADSPEGRLLETGQAVHLGPRFDRLSPRSCDAIAQEGLKTVSALPLGHEGNTVGCFLVGSRRMQHIPERVQNWLEGIAAQLGGAIVRISAEEALRESEEKYRRLHETMVDAFVLVDMDGRIQEANRAYQVMVGYTEEDLKNLTYVDLTPEKWHAFEARIVEEQILRKGYSEVYQKEYRKKDGTIFPVELRTYLIRDKAGRPSAMCAVIRDVTERILAENTLRESEERYRALAENSLTAIYVVQDDVVVYVNRVGADSLGFSTQECVGRPIWDFVPAEDLDSLKAATEAILRGDPADARFEARAVTKSGEFRWAEALCTVIEHGGRPAILTNVLDITDMKRAQEELREAKNAAEAANRTKSEFLANMSHELRTPLNATIGFAEILEDRHFGPLNEKQLKYVRHIADSGRHLLQLVTEILDLSKIESGATSLEPTQVNLCDMLENVLSIMREQALSQDLAMELKAAPEVKGITVRADKLKLRQVLFNLLSNATKFTPKGGVIRVEAQRVDDDLIVSVCDNGIGIDPSDTSLIFRAFEQVDSGLSRLQKGTGLGLSLARKFVELHGGRIWVESDGLGRGSAFRFTLPLNDRS
ncbi:MAG: PAS domain S-box protein [Desulfomonilaceae bacterium]|nr:PAS domain S-box protein [Desulfomonilaceae bacterium]